MKKPFRRLFQPAFRKADASRFSERSKFQRNINIACRAFVLVALTNSLLAAWVGTKGGQSEFDPRNLPVSDDTLGLIGRVRRPYGMAPQQFVDFIAACDQAKIAPPKIIQTIGDARASAGFHKKDGVVTENGARFDYSAAVDIRSRDLSTAQKRALLAALGDNSYVGWYRAWGANQHEHIVYVKYPMKRQLRGQFHDAMNDRNGLAGHAHYSFFKLSDAQKNKLRPEFFKNNPTNG